MWKIQISSKCKKEIILFCVGFPTVTFYLNIALKSFLICYYLRVDLDDTYMTVPFMLSKE